MDLDENLCEKCIYYKPDKLGCWTLYKKYKQSGCKRCIEFKLTKEEMENGVR